MSRVLIPYKPDFFFSVFLFATAKVAYITAMIILHLILHSAVQIYDFHIFKTSVLCIVRFEAVALGPGRVTFQASDLNLQTSQELDFCLISISKNNLSEIHRSQQRPKIPSLSHYSLLYFIMHSAQPSVFIADKKNKQT